MATGSDATADALRRLWAGGAESVRVLGELGGSDQWERLVSLARRERIDALLHFSLGRAGFVERVPAGPRQALAGARRSAAAANLRMALQLREMATALQGRNIPMIVLKGGHLAHEVYPEISVRRMGDLDVLVPEALLGAARDVFIELGYSASETRHVDEDRALRRHLAPMVRKGSLPVEIHWGLEHVNAPFAIDVDGLWNRSRAMRAFPCRVLAPEDALLHLCIHAAYGHDFIIGAYAYHDMAALIAREAIDWQGLATRARAWRAASCTYVCLRLAQAMAGASIPTAALDALCPDDFDEGLVTTLMSRRVTHVGGPDVKRLGQILRVLPERGGIGRFAALAWRRMVRGRESRELREDGSPEAHYLTGLLAGGWSLLWNRTHRDYVRERWFSAKLRRWLVERG